MVNDETKVSAQPQVIQVVEKRSGWKSFWTFLTVFFAITGLCGISGMFLLFSSGSDGEKTEKGVDDLTYTYVLGKESSENKLLAVFIDQPILTSSQEYGQDMLTALLSGSYIYGYQVKDQLVKAAEDKTIKGVILFVNSPGGTVIGARAISSGIEYYTKKTGNPVYAYVEDMAASGAYWAAASAEKIYAEQGSLVGSIGVILGPFEYYDKLVTINGVSAENGISINYITGGKYKDLGNPTRKLSEEEVKSLQTSIDQEYDVFATHVATNRKISVEKVKTDVKALLYGAAQAKALGLIDEIGNREETLAAVVARAGLSEGDYKVVKIGSHTTLFGALFAHLQKDIGVNNEAPARTCKLCGKPLYFYGNPLDY